MTTPSPLRSAGQSPAQTPQADSTASRSATCTTLGANLARAGVAPQIAQRIMRHGDYRTTLTHYTVLGLTDTAKAVDALPNIETDDDQQERATGTADARAQDDGDSNPQPYPRQLTRESRRFEASEGDNLRATGTDAADANPTKNGPCGPSDGKRANGLEPSTFSLEGCEASAERPGDTGDYDTDDPGVSAGRSNAPADDDPTEAPADIRYLARRLARLTPDQRVALLDLLDEE